MAKKIICGIYKITSPTDKIYIGQSINIIKRWRFYKNPDNKRSQTRLWNSLRKHGFENHKFEIIEECDECNLGDREIYWMEFYDSRNIIKGLNIKEGGKHGRHSEESKRLMSINNAQLGKTPWNKGKPTSEEQKILLRQANLGRKDSPETIENKRIAGIKRGGLSQESIVKMIATRAKNGSGIGWKHSEETKNKMSEFQKNRIRPKKEIEDFREQTIKRNKSRKGIPNLKLRGYKHTNEAKAKMSESSKGRMVGENHPMFGRKRPDLVERNKLSSEKFKGEGNPFYGKTHTEESKQKIRDYYARQKELKLNIL